MKDYEVEIANQVGEKLKSFPKDLQTRVLHALFMIEKDPKIGKPLKLELEGIWVYKVSNYRIKYKIDEKGRKVWVYDVKRIIKR